MRCSKNNYCQSCCREQAKRFREGKRLSKRDYAILGQVLCEPIKIRIDYASLATKASRILPLTVKG